jgi:SAM-dependent methyltransferase
MCNHSDQSSLYAESTLDQQQLTEFSFASRKEPEYMNHRLMLCARCDLLYVSEIAGVSDLRTEYDNAAYDSQVESVYAARTYMNVVLPVIRRLSDRAGALDIGTGDGAFLGELLDRGKMTNVVGLEPSAAPIRSADTKVQELIRRGMFVAGLYSSETFSLVTCFQTIEHVDDPGGLCREGLRILKPGGALVIIGHNRSGLLNRMLGRKSPIFDIEHLQLFSPSSLRRLLMNAGFESVTVQSFWNTYPISYWARLFPFPRPVKRIVTALLRATGLGRIPLSFPVGNLVAVGYRKV